MIERLYVWRAARPAHDAFDGRPWVVSSCSWDQPWSAHTYIRRFATYSEAIAHAADLALEVVPLALEVTP